MKKIELLELLLEQEKEIERLQAKNAELREKLSVRRLKMKTAGSLAEAALQLSGVFEAAQEAADIYLKSIIPESEEEKNVEETQEKEAAVDSGDRGRADPTEGEAEPK